MAYACCDPSNALFKSYFTIGETIVNVHSISFNSSLLSVKVYFGGKIYANDRQIFLN